MKNVKRTFFLTQEEVKEVNDKFNDGYIIHELPHYELEDGIILYGKIGYPDAKAWWDVPVDRKTLT